MRRNSTVYLSAVGSTIMRTLQESSLLPSRAKHGCSRFWLCLLPFIEITLFLVLVTPALSFAQADIVVKQSVDNMFPTIGSSVTFTIIVSNAGPMPAAGVQVTDQLSSGLTFGGVTQLTGGLDCIDATCSSLLWNVGDIGVKGQVILQFTATVFAVGPYTNTATRTASFPTDPIPGDDSALLTLLPVVPGTTAGIEAPRDLIGTGYKAGDTVFDFTAIDQSGNPVSLYQFYGKFVILDLTAVWCPPSRDEASQGLLTQVVTNLANHGVHGELLQVLLQNGRLAPATQRDAQLWALEFHLPNYPVLTIYPIIRS
jgi:uncharacterized repeat protein (TIGR01451 family)